MIITISNGQMPDVEPEVKEPEAVGAAVTTTTFVV
jgi:hypothetical protein